MDEHGIPGTTDGAGGGLVHDTTRRWATTTGGPADDRTWITPAPQPERDKTHPGRYLLTVAALAAVVAALYLTAVLTDHSSPGWAWLVPALATVGGFVGGFALPRRGD